MTDRAVLEQACLDLAEELAEELEAIAPDCDVLAAYRVARTSLDDWCEHCDGLGVETYVPGYGTSTCDPADVRERPCSECEPGRIAQARRDGDAEDEALERHEAAMDAAEYD